MRPTFRLAALALAAVLLAAVLLAAVLLAVPVTAQGIGAREPVRSPQARALMARWEGENRSCVDGGGAAVPCARRQITARKLRGLGWCYGRLDALGAIYEWHRCRSGE